MNKLPTLLQAPGCIITLLCLSLSLGHAAPQTFKLADGHTLEWEVGKTVRPTKGTSSLDTSLQMTSYEIRLLDAKGKVEALATYTHFSGSSMKVRQAELLGDDKLVILAEVGNALTLISYKKTEEGWHEHQSDSLAMLPEAAAEETTNNAEALSFEWDSGAEKVIAKDAGGKVMKPLSIIDMIKF